jgi:sec-independent protein translocase protein TatA
MPGMGELLIILLIVLLIFGAGKLPAIGDALGRSIRNFKRATHNEDEIEVSKKKELAEKKGKVKELAEAEDHDDDEIEEAQVVAAKRKAAKKEA